MVSTFFELIRKDIQHAARSFSKSPGFTASALAALTLGIGANTAIFSVINTVLLRPLTYPDPDRIVAFERTGPDGVNTSMSPTEFNVLQHHSAVFDDIAARDFARTGLNLTGGAFPEQVRGMQVTSSYFRLLGAPMALGRAFTDDETRPGGGHVVVSSYGLWQRRFGGDPQIVNKTIDLSGVPYVVAGVTAAGFIGEAPVDLWLPLPFEPNSHDHARIFAITARLKPGATIASANAVLQLAFEEFQRKYPNVRDPRARFVVQRLQDLTVSEVRPSLLVLAAAVALVLLIACVNVANLLLARSTGRRREIAIRTAIGARRARIVRQLLTESTLLAFVGGALGLALGMAGIRVLLTLTPVDIPRIGEHGAAIAADWRVLGFTLLVSLGTGVLFGLVPAIQSSRADLAVALRECGERSATGLRQNRTRAALVASETALAVVLLIGAALLIRTFLVLRSVDPGFDSHNILTLDTSLVGSRFSNTAALAQLSHDAIQRVEALPGVVSAASTCFLPLEVGPPGLPFDIMGRPLAAGEHHGRANWLSISPHYFDVLRIPLIRGRVFTDQDGHGATPVVIINQTMARKFWGDRDPLHERIQIGKGYGPQFEDVVREVIGVVGDIRNQISQPPDPAFYVPVSQAPDAMTTFMTRLLPEVWIVRTTVEPHSLRRAIQKQLEQASGGLPAGHTRSMKEIASESMAGASFDVSLLSIFGAAALLLAALGIYGLMSYTVEQRSHEIGIRLALGAGPGVVRNMIVLEGMRLALAGIAVGIIAALGLTRLLVGFLYGVQPRDPLIFAAVPLVLASVALASIWLPARRASSVDPLLAIRAL